jgi:hypothetical protein
LRKQDPEHLIEIVEMFTQKRNAWIASKEDDPSKSRKLQFLYLELQDIKNNKGSETLQVRSIQHL